jgi:hypothetical protein
MIGIRHVPLAAIGKLHLFSACVEGGLRPQVADAVVEDLLQLLTSAVGTKRRKPRQRVYVSFWGVAEVHGRTASADFDANDPSATLAVHCGNGFDARFDPYQSAGLSR